MNSKAFETGTCIFRILDKIGEKALQVSALIQLAWAIQD